MEWKDLQPFATIIAAIIGGVVTAYVTLKLQDKKRNDDLDLKAFEHSLIKRLKEFERIFIVDNSYSAEKGKNLATKEDIEEMTHKVESVRNEFATTTEVLKWQLSKKANLHKLQAEKEFEVYSKLWNIATELRLSFEELRPSFDLQPQGIDWADLRKKRKEAIINSRNDLMIEVEKQRPFYSETLYFESLFKFSRSQLFQHQANHRQLDKCL